MPWCTDSMAKWDGNITSLGKQRNGYATNDGKVDAKQVTAKDKEYRWQFMNDKNRNCPGKHMLWLLNCYAIGTGGRQHGSCSFHQVNVFERLKAYCARHKTVMSNNTIPNRKQHNTIDYKTVIETTCHKTVIQQQNRHEKTQQKVRKHEPSTSTGDE